MANTISQMGTEQYAHIDWERTPPEKRGRWGRWLRIKRDADAQETVRAMLAKMGRPIGPSYYSEMETGKKTVNEDWRGVFVRAYGSSAEDWDDPWEVAPVAAEGDLVAAIRELVEEVRQSRIASDRNADVLAQILAVAVEGVSSRIGNEADAPGRLGTGRKPADSLR